MRLAHMLKAQTKVELIILIQPQLLLPQVIF